MDLINMIPADSLSSTGYVLAKVGSEYLVYQPANASFTVQLPAGTFDYEWINPLTGQNTSSGRLSVTGEQNFTLPVSYTAGGLLYLKAIVSP